MSRPRRDVESSKPAVIQAAVAVGLILLATAPRIDAQRPELGAILSRAGEYVGRYMEVLSSLTAEERYTQTFVTVNDRWSVRGGASTINSERRTIAADVVLVQVGAPLGWRVFRDVFEVDGKPVRDRTDRLTKLFLEPAATARAQATRIATESARFNMTARFSAANVTHTLNVPGLPLSFLQPGIQERFNFTLDRRDDDAWVVGYEEQASPTIFRHNNTLDNPSTGRVWIRADTGEVTRTEHIVQPQGLKATFTTMFRHDRRFEIALPTELREAVSSIRQGNRSLDGRARYENFRRFEVKSEETIDTQSSEATSPVPDTRARP